MNPILEQVLDNRNGFYVHCVEVDNIYTLQDIAESIYSEFENDYSFDQIAEFLDSLEVYVYSDERELTEKEEEEIFNFSFSEYLKELI